MKLTLIIFASFLINFSFQLTQECFDEFSRHTHPSKCCNYPLIIPHEHPDVITCQGNCKYTEKCCRIECLFSKLEIFDGDTLHKENLEKVLIEELKEESLKEEWKEPLRKSLETCEKFVDWKRSPDDTCKIPKYAFQLIDCVFEQNFLNCPNFNATEDCNEVKNYVTNDHSCKTSIDDKKLMQLGFWLEWKVRA